MNHFLTPIELAGSIKRLVVKVGTSVLADQDRSRVAKHCVESVASESAALWKSGKEVVLVTSGAIGVGMGILHLKRRPTHLAQLQAAAATGQGVLMQWYIHRLEDEGLHVAQILLTREDLEDRKRYLNAKATLLTLLGAGIVPIINENDTVSVEEIRYGDNDVLSAHVASLIGAQLLVILSDVDRLIGPPDPVRVVTEITPELERVAQGTREAFSTGGMRTKLEAAKIAMGSGIPMVLMNGRGRNNLTDLFFKGEDRGTWFLPKKGSGLKGKERWVAFTGRPRGMIVVDAGARQALVHGGGSLLASGVRGVEGNFRRGDLISVCEEIQDLEFARGIVSYSHIELEKIKGMKSDAISALLGRKASEVIHRNSLVIIRG